MVAVVVVVVVIEVVVVVVVLIVAASTLAVVVQVVSISQNGALQYIPVLPEWPRPQSQFILAFYSRPYFISFGNVAPPPHPPSSRLSCYSNILRSIFQPLLAHDNSQDYVVSYSRQAGNCPTGIVRLMICNCAIITGVLV